MSPLSSDDIWTLGCSAQGWMFKNMVRNAECWIPFCGSLVLQIVVLDRKLFIFWNVTWSNLVVRYKRFEKPGTSTQHLIQPIAHEPIPAAVRLLEFWVRVPPETWMCLFSVSCVVRQRSLRRADHSSRGVLPTQACYCVWSNNLKNEEVLARVGL